jgi:IS1 family transposase
MSEIEQQPASDDTSDFGRELDALMPSDTTVSEPVKKDNTQGPNNLRDTRPKQPNAVWAEKRINATNQKLRNRIAELEEKIKTLSRSEAPEDIAAKQQAITEANTYQNIVSSAEADAFEERAYQVFGNNAPRFMEDTYKWAQHVNRNEPELRTYIDRPYGYIMLAEWYKRAADPQLFRQWNSMTAYERGKVLDTFYGELEKLGRGGHVVEKGKVVENIPAPTGGRNTNKTPPPDDFGLALQDAINKFGATRK